MPPLSSTADVLSSEPFTVIPDAAGDSAQEVAVESLRHLQLALLHFCQKTDDANRWQLLLSARRTAAETIARLPRKDTHSLLANEARQQVGVMLQAGVYDRVTAAEDLDQANALLTKGWPGLLAAMVLTPAWAWAAAPKLESVPDWLVEDYVRWIFTPPQVFHCAGEVQLYAMHVRSHLADLAGWVKRSAGSAAVRLAAGTYLEMDLSRALAASADDLRACAELRGVIAQQMLGGKKSDFEPMTLPRIGRRMRVGFVAEQFGEGPEVRLLSPLFAQLDKERFDVTLIAGRESAVAPVNHAGEIQPTWVLPAEQNEQLSVLRAAELDVLVFGTNLSARMEGVSRLALHRIAPLQVALPSSGHTTGLVQIDLFLAGEMGWSKGTPEQFTERLGYWPGPSHVVNRELGRQAAGQSWTKASLGIAEGAVVFVSEAAYDLVTPEVIETWAGLLAQVPGSQLILHPFGAGVAGDRAANFSSLVEAALQRHGVDTGRLLLSTLELANPGDVQALLSVGDVYLETFPTNSIEGLLRALEAGLPIVACEGKTLRSSAGAAWLESLGLKSLVAHDAATYVATAKRLALEPAARAEAVAIVKKQMTHLPLFADSLALSEGFGGLLESAFDQLSSLGEKSFKAERSPLRPAAPAATDLQGRWNVGRQLSSEGRTARSVDYFMAAIAADDGTAALWLDTARALRANSQSQDAVQALETALRLDPKLVEGWKLLAEIAELAMIPDLAAEARQIVDTLTAGQDSAVPKLAGAAPKVESIVGKLRSLRVARKGIV